MADAPEPDPVSRFVAEVEALLRSHVAAGGAWARSIHPPRQLDDGTSAGGWVYLDLPCPPREARGA